MRSIEELIEALAGHGREMTKVERLQADLDDVASAIKAMPSDATFEEQVDAEPETFRFKIMVPGGHLEAPIPEPIRAPAFAAMRQSLEDRKAEIERELAIAKAESVGATETAH